MKFLPVLLISLFLISGCGSRYKYWELKKFSLQPYVLRNGDPIKVLYTSGSPDNYDSQSFIHLIVVSQKTNDTVNVLTTADNGFESIASGETFHFFSPDSDEVRLINADLSSVTHINDLKKLPKPDFSEVTRVLRDPAYDAIADNHYPAIIGWIGKIRDAGH